MATVNYQALLLQDGVSSNAELGLRVSDKVLPKIFEREGFVRGYMVDGTYEAEGQNVASVVIPTLARPDGVFENMKGDSYNPFQVDAYRMDQGHIQLDVDREYRQPIEIAEDQIVQNLIGGSVVSTLSSYVGWGIGEAVNRFTANYMVKGANEYNSTLALADRKIRYVTFGTTVIPDAMADLKALIGNADPNPDQTLYKGLGDSSFNSLPVSQVISNRLEAELLHTKNQFILESSYGQEILIEGTFGRITLKDNSTYKGKILGVDTFVLADSFFPNAAAREGLFDNKPAAGKVLGIMAVSVATYRIFVDRGMKIVDAVAFRGLRIQPLYRLGIKVAKPWGIGLLVSDDYADENLQAPAMTKIEMEAGTSTAGDSKFKTLTGPSGAAFLYKKGTKAEVIKINKKYANGTDGWTTATAGTTVVNSCVAGEVITVIAVVASGDDAGKVLASGTHTLVTTEIKA